MVRRSDLPAPQFPVPRAPDSQVPVSNGPGARLPGNVPQAAGTPPAGSRPSHLSSPSGTQTANWRKWFPGLDNESLTLRQVLATLPAAPPAAIPWIVRLFENPAGLLRLHGAVSLADHDKIHVLLGRGLLDQDEAFVLGFTMGCTKEVSRLERWFFKYALSHLYPHPYRIPSRILTAYDLGLEAGLEFGLREMHMKFNEKMLDLPLGTVRAELGIDTRRLRRYYARERAALPDTPASQRLPPPV
jgi:hypothetical protein